MMKSNSTFASNFIQKKEAEEDLPLLPQDKVSIL